MTNQRAIGIIKTAIAEVEWGCPMDYAEAFDMAIKALERQDDPDRVKVVRCRDCESWWPDTNEENCSSGFCRNQFGVCCGQTPDMNWFCADGERR